MTELFTYSIVWDSAPVRQSYGENRVVFDGVVTVTLPRGKSFDYRVNVSATRGGRKPDFMLRYMTAGKRGHAVPENHLAGVREYLAGAAAEHLADYRAAYVAEAQERDRAGRNEVQREAGRQTLKLAGLTGTEPLKLDHAEALSATESPVRVVDCTPTWRAILPLLLAAITDGTATGQNIAREELGRMADAADKWNAHCKESGE